MEDVSTTTTSIWDSWDGTKSVSQSHPAGGYRFPGNLASDRPVMIIKCNQGRAGLSSGPASIFLPAPEGFAFSNSATYDDAELGVLGGAALGALKGVQNKDGLDKIVKEGAGNLIASDKSKQLAALIGDNNDPSAKAVGIASKSTLNKNITTEFTGVGTRTFDFSYKLIPSTAAESATIKGMVAALTVGLYPEVDGPILKYPPTWSIEFLSSLGGGPLPGVPKIFECYLTAFDVTYNSSINNFYNDSTPIETDIKMSFKETRALTAQDISQLL